MQLNHLHLRVANVNRAAAFYKKYFGMRPHEWREDALFLRDAGGMDLALAPGGSESLTDRFHFGFRLTSPEAVAALYDRMIADRVSIAVPLEADSDMISFRCKDPDGYAIEVYWEE